MMNISEINMLYKIARNNKMSIKSLVFWTKTSPGMFIVFIVFLFFWGGGGIHVKATLYRKYR